MITSYADDTNQISVSNLALNLLLTTANWIKENQLILNTKKNTKLVFFKTKNKQLNGKDSL